MFNSNLSNEEKERISYINGNVLIASAYGEVAELEAQVDGFDAIVSATKESAFVDGKESGMGMNTAQQIYDLERQLREANETIQNLQKVKNNFRNVFYLDDMKTVAGRKRILINLDDVIIRTSSKY